MLNPSKLAKVSLVQNVRFMLPTLSCLSKLIICVTWILFAWLARSTEEFPSEEDLKIVIVFNYNTDLLQIFQRCLGVREQVCTGSVNYVLLRQMPNGLKQNKKRFVQSLAPWLDRTEQQFLMDMLQIQSQISVQVPMSGAKKLHIIHVFGIWWYRCSWGTSRA